MESKALWAKRAEERFREIVRYGRYLANDHMALFLLIVLGAGGFYYQRWLENIPDTFPADGVIAALFAFLAARGSVITFFRAPDRVFLLPLEAKMGPYLIRCFLFSAGLNAAVLFFFAIAALPLHLRAGGTGTFFFAFFLTVLVMKAANLAVRWCWFMDHEAGPESRLFDFLIRFFANGAAFYYFLKGQYLFFAAVLAVFFLYSAYFWKRQKGKGLPWERLIENEERRMQAFYRLANMATDVPDLAAGIRRRRWLDPLLRRIPYGRDSAFRYLTARTFFRSGDYFPLYLRLTGIGILLNLIVSDFRFSALLSLFLLFGTGYQLLDLRRHHEAVLWLDLYPLPEEKKAEALLHLLGVLLSAQAACFAAVPFLRGDWQYGLLWLGGSALFVLWFLRFYCRGRLAKRKDRDWGKR
ncbi:ABC transporter permease [Caldibacillus debilis]|uniref:ABC transporter permease n=1 Tax=Caldibacillus debilis TaxID=301148 RepID=UPI002FD8BAAA